MDNINIHEVIYLQRVAIADLGIKSTLNYNLLIAVKIGLHIYYTPRMEHVALTYSQCLEITDYIGFSDCITILMYMWTHMADIPCESSDVACCHTFMMISGRMPTIDEYNEYNTNLLSIEADPDRYCDEQRVKVATPGIDQMIPFTSTSSNESCSICLESIMVDSLIIRLPQCGHVFHAMEDDCLGAGCTIKTWLEKSHHCPNCNTDVSFTSESGDIIVQQITDVVEDITGV
jgi:hypothetical protein